MKKYIKTSVIIAAATLFTVNVYAQQTAEAKPGMTAEARAKFDEETDKRAAEWVASLNLNNPAKETAVKGIIATHLKTIRDWNNEHPAATVPAGINPATGNPLSAVDRQVIAISAMPKLVHETLMTGLRQNLDEAQVEAILDKYTIGKVAFTMNGYRSIVPNLTPEEEKVLTANLKKAREQAVDYKNMTQISAIFEIYKTKNEQYLNTHGRNWHDMFKAYTDAVKAKKAAAKAAAESKPAN
ncbi:DUF3826 domain-containing protein [Mucilaginibacter aquatilis]|uniref:DUF3826 domain-containing protein n=1 Tax=Mucilaginibacter aquatilis TaxID=1517760 RepID=A0A6I4I4R3_9SPHI|nr:DUF3826 domain-containing protein [Mucilaginibacter aquatilis]MVN90060.1 DUF3826 domain-containing protein [Mucilaginibacter aquatilis]